MNDRLLTDAEQDAFFENTPENADYWLELCKAQDRKTARVILMLIEERFGDGHDKPLIQIGVQEWQDFKKELGI